MQSFMEHQDQQVDDRAGFTLVEMLIAVTLVLMMMMLFAEIFELASDSMTLQMALADNDQQVRTVTTLLRADLQKRTFKKLVPYYFNEAIGDPGTSFSGRKGYFFASWNSMASSGDNLLQWTVDAANTSENSDETDYFGKATLLGPAGEFIRNPNQPEHDNGQIVPDGTASSRAAEIAYFMRGGNLYRRIVLIRDPLPIAGAETAQPTRDSVEPAEEYLDPANSLYSGEYWQDFDFSARNDAITGGTIAGARLSGFELLNNRGDQASFDLGKSRYRFGFDRITGLSREFSQDSSAANRFFIGRFTHEETSHSDFNYPQTLSTVGSGNPYDTSGTPLTDTNPADGVIDEFADGTRIGEDLLLTDVHEFRIEFWDDRVGDFVQLGHSLSGPGPDGLPGTGDDEPGDFHSSRLQASSYAAPGGEARVFDTWHRLYDRDNADGGNVDDPTDPVTNPPPLDIYEQIDSAPYRPMTYDPSTGSTLHAPTPPNSSGVSHYTVGTSYAVDDVVFPPTTDEDYDGKDDSMPTLKGTSPTSPVKGDDGRGYLGRVFYYRCVKAGTATGVSPPNGGWKSDPGAICGDRNPADPQPAWETVENLRPVRAMRITIRFVHSRSGKMRQLTLIQPLLSQTIARGALSP